MQFIGFDFGTSHIGVAVGQSLTETASPLLVLDAKEGVPDWQKVAELLDSWRPEGLVVGLPLNMDGSESEMSVRAKKFANRLHGRFGLPVALYDERLSSFEAKALQRDSGARQKHNTIDAVAASLILENWLQQRAS